MIYILCFFALAFAFSAFLSSLFAFRGLYEQQKEITRISRKYYSVDENCSYLEKDLCDLYNELVMKGLITPKEKN